MASAGLLERVGVRVVRLEEDEASSGQTRQYGLGPIAAMRADVVDGPVLQSAPPEPREGDVGSPLVAARAHELLERRHTSQRRRHDGRDRAIHPCPNHERRNTPSKRAITRSKL